jgi:hypothetical protein
MVLLEEEEEGLPLLVLPFGTVPAQEGLTTSAYLRRGRGAQAQEQHQHQAAQWRQGPKTDCKGCWKKGLVKQGQLAKQEQVEVL